MSEGLIVVAESELSTEELTERTRDLRILLLDVDGVFTDGSIILTGDDTETKAFDVKDGMGVTLAQEAGIEVGIITGRVSDVVRRRAHELGIQRVFQGYGSKGEALSTIQGETGFELGEMAFIGDDVQDLAVMSEVGLSFAPADAHSSVRNRVEVTLDCRGGRGAIREAVDFLLESRGQKASIYDRFSNGFFTDVPE